MKDKKIFIDITLCKGCCICIEVCPHKVFEKKAEEDGKTYPIPVHGDKCKDCGLCEIMCPDFAIAISGG